MTQAQATEATQTLPAQTEEQSGEIIMAPRKASLVAKPRHGGNSMAIIPQDIEQAYRLAGAICAANMAPKSYGRDANAVMIGIMHGMEVGFTPMAALQSIAVINGMPSIWGDGALALIEASGLLEDKEERIETDDNGGLVAICRMKRKGRSWTEQRFSWQDAKIAKLDQKDTYKLYGRRMLQRRARAWCMTDGFADVLRGLHIREAVDDGALVQSASGAYEVAQAPAEVAPPRPTRSTKEDQERARKVAMAQDAQYRQTMQEEPEQADGEQGEPEDVVEHVEPVVETQRAAQPAPEATNEHVSVENVIRKKLADLKGIRTFKPAFMDYMPEIEKMRSEDKPRYDRLMADVFAKHPELKEMI